MSIYDIQVESTLSHPGPTHYVQQVLEDLGLDTNWSLETVNFQDDQSTILVPSNEFIVVPHRGTPAVYRATLSPTQIRSDQNDLEGVLGMQLLGTWSISPY